MTRLARLMPAVVLMVAVGACRPGADRPEGAATLCVAASLNDVVRELAEDCTASRGFEYVVTSGPSGGLCHQIELGAPCDVFLSADPALIDQLVREGKMIGSTKRTVATNRLVIAVASDHGGSLQPADLVSERFTRIAMADPEAAPAGRYARQALEAMGLWDALESKAVFASDVRAAARLLELRTVDAAVVYATDAAAIDGIRAAYTFAPTQASVEYVGAVAASARHEKASAAFLEFIASPAAAPIWMRNGFAIDKQTLSETAP